MPLLGLTTNHQDFYNRKVIFDPNPDYLQFLICGAIISSWHTLAAES